MRVVHVLAICAMATIGTAASAQDVDWKKVDEVLGRSGAVTGDVHRYGFPRTDLQVTLDGVTIRPALALGGWAAFKPMHGGAMVMGDLVLLETEINRSVMTSRSRILRCSMSWREPFLRRSPARSIPAIP